MKSRLLFTAVCVLFCFKNSFAQKEIKVVDFSEQYSATIVLNKNADPEERFEPNAIITFSDKLSDKKVLKTDVFLNIDYDLNEGGEVKSNIVEMPYGEQSAVICGDFNCDGKDDFAVLVGYIGCYGGPGYDVFIQKADGTFALDKEFSRLGQEYCGFFSHDCDEKKITVMTKSGCCWHLTEKYELVGGMPVLSASYVEDHLSDMPNVTITKWKNGKEVSKTKELYLDDSNGRAEYILNFKLQDRDKTVLLAVTGEGLSYYFLDADNKVELEYTGSFSLTKDGDRYKLLFSRPGAHYEVYSDSNNIGINVKVGKKIYNMTGLMPEKHNTLSYLWGMDVENIEVKE